MSKKSNRQKATPAPVAPEPSLTSAVAGASGGGAAMDVCRDDIEPQANRAAMPAWLFILLTVMVYWGMLHLDQYAGGFNENVYGPYHSYKELTDLQPKSGPEMLVAKGEAIYTMLCVTCHQPSGLGSPGQYPPLAQSDWVVGSPNRLIRIPIHGLSGPIQVNDQTWNGSMPAFGTTPPMDSDENIAAVLSYIRQAWGNKAPPIPPEQVKAVREQTASRSSPWTADELQKVPE